MAIKAQGQHYFQNDDCRINISKVIRKQNLTHEHDLTETEHYHDFIEVVFIVNGQGIQVLEGNEYDVSAGDVFVLQGNQKHFFKNADDIGIINLMFDNKHHSANISNKIKKLDGFNALFILEPRYRTTHHFKNKLRLTREELAPIELTLNTMILEQKKKDIGFEIILKNRLEELVILLSRHYASIKTTQAKSLVRIAKVVDYLENNFENQIYIEKLAEISCMSTRNFMRTFKGAVGLTPINYLKQVRLQNARKQLRETSHNVTEVAVQCGFTDSNYFIKSFKQAYGVTPNKFRKRW